MISINTLIKVKLIEETILDIDKNKMGKGDIKAYLEYGNTKRQFKQRYVDHIDIFKDLVSEENFLNTLQTKFEYDDEIDKLISCLEWCDYKYIVCGEIRHAYVNSISLETVKKAVLREFSTAMCKYIHSEKMSQDTIRMVFYNYLEQSYDIHDIYVIDGEVGMESVGLSSVGFDKACEKYKADIGILFKEDLSMAFEFDEDNDGEAIFASCVDIGKLLRKNL